VKNQFANSAIVKCHSPRLPPKPNSTQGIKSVRTNENNGPILFDGGVDIVVAFGDGYYPGDLVVSSGSVQRVSRNICQR